FTCRANGQASRYQFVWIGAVKSRLYEDTANRLDSISPGHGCGVGVAARAHLKINLPLGVVAAQVHVVVELSKCPAVLSDRLGVLPGCVTSVFVRIPIAEKERPCGLVP